MDPDECLKQMMELVQKLLTDEQQGEVAKALNEMLFHAGKGSMTRKQIIVGLAKARYTLERMDKAYEDFDTALLDRVDGMQSWIERGGMMPHMWAK